MMQGFYELFTFARRELNEALRIDLSGGIYGRPPECSCSFGEIDKGGAAVGWIRVPLDQLIPFHAVERTRHRCLLDSEVLAEISLHDAILLPKFEQHHELRGGEAERLDAIRQHQSEQPGGMIDEIAGRVRLKFGRYDIQHLQTP